MSIVKENMDFGNPRSERKYKMLGRLIYCLGVVMAGIYGKFMVSLASLCFLFGQYVIVSYVRYDI